MQRFVKILIEHIDSALPKSIAITFMCLHVAIHSFAQYQKEIKFHKIYSPFQKDSTTVRVLLPDTIVPGKNYRVLYVLPVREEFNRKSGDGLEEIIKYDFHNKYELICVSPGYTHMPWYADHSVDKSKQDESHLLKTVLPFVDDHYPTVKTKEGRLLLGFSKSGWGALTLLLRNPEVFYKAAGWDIGIRMDTGLESDHDYVEAVESTFGDLANFEKYRVSTLLKNNGRQLGSTPRIFYYNREGNRGLGGAKIHLLMVELEIPHKYLFEPFRKHRWDSGWLPETISFLVEE
jgi:hypothetical protein